MVGTYGRIFLVAEKQEKELYKNTMFLAAAMAHFAVTDDSEWQTFVCFF